MAEYNEILGTEEADDIKGTRKADEIHGGEGDDTIYGKHGDDTIYGGTGWDWIEGGKGDDTLHGGKGSDTIYGGKGNDKLYGDNGNGKHSKGKSEVYSIDDREEQSKYGDSIYGGPGNDSIMGGYGADYIKGGPGNDRIWDRGNGNDWIYGGPGNDVIEISGTGLYENEPNNNRLNGGPGNDEFKFFFLTGTRMTKDLIFERDWEELKYKDHHEVQKGFVLFENTSRHIIEDFTQGEDKIRITGGTKAQEFDAKPREYGNGVTSYGIVQNLAKFEELNISQGEHGAIISDVGYLGLHTIVLLGVNAEDLTAEDFGW